MSARMAGGPSFSKPRSKLRKWLPALLLLGAIACLLGALLQFRLSKEVTQATVILVLDASDSMLETDVAPSRLEAARDAAKSFLEEVPPDFRVGLVTFATAVDVASPPTIDRAPVRDAVDSISTEHGTHIGDGLEAALDSLEQDRRTNGEGPAAILLLTDGEDSGSRVQPAVAADRARLLGTPVYTVLLGEARIRDGVSNAALLRDMATSTRGRAFNAETAGELDDVYRSLGTGLSVELAVTNIGTPFLIGAGILGLAAGFALVRGSEGVDWR